MNSTVSVSKGCFAFPKKGKRKHTLGQYPTEPWYRAYKNAWTSFEEELEEIERKSLKEVLKGVLNYVADSRDHIRQADELPSATLLTGVNMTDHIALFATLTSELKKEVTPHVAVLWAHDCNNLKTTVERLCSQFMTIKETEEDDDENDEDHEMETVNSGLSKVHCTFPVLVKWYNRLSNNRPILYKTKKLQSTGAGKPLAVVIPNFECFSHKVLQDFILILSANRKTIPLTLILGVATSMSAVHRSLPHHVSSKLRIQLFHTQSTSAYLNKILDTVILNPERPFHLGSKTFSTLLDVFLYHDFSVAGFIQEFKYCMTEHFYGKKWTALCCHKSDLQEVLNSLTLEELKSVMSLLSLRRHIESLPTREEKSRWFNDNEFIRREILRLLLNLHESCSTFYFALRTLQIFLTGLPKSPLGKSLREIYAAAISTNITSVAGYQEFIKHLQFQARDELIEKLEKVLHLFSDVCVSEQLDYEDVKELILELKCLDENLSSANSASKLEHGTSTSPSESPTKTGMRILTNRVQFKEKIFEMATQRKCSKSPYEELRETVLSRLKMFWEEALVPPTTQVLHEIMFFDDLAAVRPNIIGTPRLAVHTALNDPHRYLQCECCQLSSQSEVAPSLPDLSIVYKLHLESGRLINMYDWLQAYLTVVRPDSTEEEQQEVDPKLQARFTRAVAELQFLGYVKSSARKTDHVTRLTWA